MSAQPTLFELPPIVPEERVWRRIAGALGKLNTVHVHNPSGWRIEHCGHATANFPYIIYRPSGEGILAPNGRGFQRLDIAKAYVEQHSKEEQ